MLEVSTLAFPKFTRYVGTAPGTTTITISGAAGLGDSPTLVHHASRLWLNPYEDIASLKGLSDDSTTTAASTSSPRWDLFIAGLGLSFAGVVTYAWMKRKKKR